MVKKKIYKTTMKENGKIHIPSELLKKFKINYESDIIKLVPIKEGILITKINNKRKKKFIVNEIADIIIEDMLKSSNYSKVARFGYKNILKEFKLKIDKNLINTLRLEGLNNLIESSLKLIKKCKPLMKKKGTLKELKDCEKKLIKIKRVIIPTLSKTIINMKERTKRIEIKEDNYNKILEIVEKIKSNIYKVKKEKNYNGK